METVRQRTGQWTKQSGDSAVASSVTPANALENAIPKTTEANLFILFDTSNYMYRSFVFAQDAIADFIRSMDGSSKIAFYSYSRNLLRATTLTPDSFQVIDGVRSSVAGDDAALYNSLLLTVKDAAPLKGRKAIVVFSNGPDNASSVPPEDVAELAESTGTIIYILSTRQAQDDPASAAAFERVSKASGGKAYFAKDWRQEKKAFASIREDLSHLYTLSYYPQPNPNRGWRSIKVKLVGKDLQKYHIRTRDDVLHSASSRRAQLRWSFPHAGPEHGPHVLLMFEARPLGDLDEGEVRPDEEVASALDSCSQDLLVYRAFEQGAEAPLQDTAG